MDIQALYGGVHSLKFAVGFYFSAIFLAISAFIAPDMPWYLGFMAGAIALALIGRYLHRKTETSYTWGISPLMVGCVLSLGVSFAIFATSVAHQRERRETVERTINDPSQDIFTGPLLGIPADPKQNEQ